MCKNSGFRSRIQKSYKKFGIESKNLIIFSESIPNLFPPPSPSENVSWMHIIEGRTAIATPLKPI